MKILLINPPSYLHQTKYKRIADTFPLGILYVARSLLDNGHKVKLFDIFAEDLSTNSVINRLKRYKGRNFDLVGITAMSVQYAYVKWISEMIKREFGNIPIIVGGALAIFSYKLLLANTNVDIAVTGEGERAIINLIKESSLNKVRGIAYKEEGNVNINPPEDLIKDLDEIGYPAYELLPIDIYRKEMQFQTTLTGENGRTNKIAVKYFNVSGGRGCPYDCNFCSRCFAGFRLRSVDSIIEEIRYFKEKYNFGGLMFIDELALTGKNRMVELAEELKSLNLYWTANGRASYFDKEILKVLKDSGCFQVTFGIESGSQRILDNMNKKQTTSIAHKVLKDVLEVGLKANVQLIFGYPGEDEDSIKETYNFFKDLPINVGFAILTPLPGSKLYGECLEKKIINNEDKYLSDLETGFSALHINLTKWSDKEFLKRLEKLSREINENTKELRERDLRVKIGFFKLLIYKSTQSLKRKLLGFPIFGKLIRKFASYYFIKRTVSSERKYDKKL